MTNSSVGAPIPVQNVLSYLTPVPVNILGIFTSTNRCPSSASKMLYPSREYNIVLNSCKSCKQICLDISVTNRVRFSFSHLSFRIQNFERSKTLVNCRDREEDAQKVIPWKALSFVGKEITKFIGAGVSNLLDKIKLC